MLIPHCTSIYTNFSNKDILAQLDKVLQFTASGEKPSLPKILLVDDNPKRLASLQATLSGANLHVQALSSIEQVEAKIIDVGQVDILVCDFHMGGSTGIDVFREVKHHYGQCQCILLTSRQHHSVLIDVIRLGVSDVLEKPIYEHILLQSIHKIWQTESLRRSNQELMARLQETLDVLVERDILLRVLYNSTADGVMVVSENGRILETNDACEALFSYDKEQFKHLYFAQIMSASSWRKLQVLLGRSNNEQKFSVEVDGIDGAGQIVPVSISFSKINYHGHRVYAGIMRNISRLVSQREQLKQQKELLEVKVAQRTRALEDAKNVAEQANNSKTEFLANMSHELRTPMHSILSFARFGQDMIASNNIKVDKLDKYYSRITSSGNKLLKLLNNLLDLSKLDAGKFPFSPNMGSIVDAVNHVVAEVSGLAEEKAIDIRVINQTSVGKIWCDVEMVQQIVRNLLGNAIRFSHQQGKIFVAVSDVQMKTRFGESPAVQIAVKDQGVGIPELELEHVFNQFSQSSKTNKGAGGTGLGLAICKDLVSLHKGEIFAMNNPQGGAIFTVILPARGDTSIEK